MEGCFGDEVERGHGLSGFPNADVQLRMPFTDPKGFNYQQLKRTIEEGSWALSKVGEPKVVTPPGPMAAAVQELHRAAGFRPLQEAPPNT